ncbi:DUF1801 domain-containing protein [Muriicola sp. Z0-33]|uniref:DUF1801 domain-containing protein n=1 Tax=Muriicola sp. Z0-33 TaxID=2816957 RepID=UPI002238D3F8|nr:DUF1801 domain-containing protein [Muriicola sp. Z0-33]MCW5515527.1 DUF1801 domain-containing protein [Muriicola sp. Z0-33]
MSGNKTLPNEASVTQFLDKISAPQKKEDAYFLLELMKDITGEAPVMWGPSIIGFGSYHYKYDSGREGDMLLTGFSPRAQNFSLYIMAGFDRYEPLMKKLGKHSTGKTCLYIKRLSDIDIEVLKELIATSYIHYNKKYNG